MTDSKFINERLKEINAKNDVKVIDIITSIGKLPKEKQQAEYAKVKDYLKSFLVVKRLYAQTLINDYNKICEEHRNKSRMYEIGKARGIINILLEREIKALYSKIKDIKDRMSELGNAFSVFLDLWQFAGADIYDLFDLCCTEPKAQKSVLQDLESESMLFSEIMFVHYLDYNHDSELFIDYIHYAPFTLCLKEYHIKLIKSIEAVDPEIRNQTREKITELFPDISKCIVTQTKDSEGNKYLVDCDNKPVAFMGVDKPLSDNIKTILKTAFKAVLIDSDTSDNKTVKFVESVIANANMDIQKIKDYLHEADDNNIDDLIDMIAPRCISEDNIIEIMNAVDYIV